MFNLLTLPIELLLSIFNYLVDSDICRISETCSELNYAVELYGMWYQLCSDKYHIAIKPDSDINWKSVYKNLKVGLRIHKKKEIKLHTDIVRYLLYNQQDSTLITASYDHSIKIMNYEKGKVTSTLNGHTDSVIGLQIMDNKLISCSRDSTIKIWNLPVATNIETLTGHNKSVVCLKNLNDQYHLVSGSFDKNIIMWDINTCQKLRRYDTSNQVRWLDTMDNNIISGGDDGFIRIWDRDLKTLTNKIYHSSRVHSVIYHDNLLISGGEDSIIKIWDTRNNKCMGSLSGHTDCIRYLQFDNNHIISGSWDCNIKIWSLVAAKELVSLPHYSYVLCFQSLNNKILSGTYDGYIFDWKIK